MPVIQALRRTGFQGCIEGYEINERSYKIACSNITQYALKHQYRVYNSLFDEAHLSTKTYLVANPPYLPAPHRHIRLPFIYGGTDGADVTKQLLECDFENIVLLLSSYSCPEDIVYYALQNHYILSNFLISPAKFSDYSSEPIVKETIRSLREQKRAFYSENIYLLAGVLFQKNHLSQTVNLSNEFLQIMTSLHCEGEFHSET